MIADSVTPEQQACFVLRQNMWVEKLGEFLVIMVGFGKDKCETIRAIL